LSEDILSHDSTTGKRDQKPLIPGGYILLSRRTLESGIMQKPPLYFKIWAWLLLRAQYTNYGDLRRGQVRTSIPEIQEAMSYYVGYRKEKPSKKEVWGVLEWLRNPSCAQSCEHPYEGNAKVTTAEPMIETTKVTHGMVINIVKYSYYQNPKNYEGNSVGNDEGTTKDARRKRQGNNSSKKDIRNKHKDVYTHIFEHWNSKDIIKHRSLNDRAKGSINAKLEDYTSEEICQAVDNYAAILRDDRYYFTYKWTLQEFLQRGFETFLTWEVAHQNYLKDEHEAPQGGEKKWRLLEDELRAQTLI
jgi:hypothetical protein